MKIQLSTSGEDTAQHRIAIRTAARAPWALRSIACKKVLCALWRGAALQLWGTDCGALRTKSQVPKSAGPKPDAFTLTHSDDDLAGEVPLQLPDVHLASRVGCRVSHAKIASSGAVNRASMRGRISMGLHRKHTAARWFDPQQALLYVPGICVQSYVAKLKTSFSNDDDDDTAHQEKEEAEAHCVI